MKRFLFIASFVSAAVLSSCVRLSQDDSAPDASKEILSLEDVARMLSDVGIGLDQMAEVHDAVSASQANGYDEEYTMKDLFASPGAGVGDSRIESKAASDRKNYDVPMRELIAGYFNRETKGADRIANAEEYLQFISSSDMQIYWPFFENWDGETLPTISFDPLGDASSNIGYRLSEDGGIREVTVTEETAKDCPVWIVNRNDDSSFETLEILRKNHPEWSEGGSVIVKTKAATATDYDFKTLVLQDMTVNRNFDSFFAGGSEFFIKLGKLDSFTASTEAEMYLYNPEITDFMVKVKRNEVGKTKQINTLLVSEWTEQLNDVALMIIEDDGGTQTSWKCTAVVKMKSKSYGIELEIPYHSRDDIVWRGKMNRKYIEKNDRVAGYFGEMLLTFAVI